MAQAIIRLDYPDGLVMHWRRFEIDNPQYAVIFRMLERLHGKPRKAS